MLALVVVRVPVPPQAAGPDALRATGLAARDLWFVLLVHAARRRSLRSEVVARGRRARRRPVASRGAADVVGKYEEGPGRASESGDIRRL
ncbi:hypothetical protein GCM10010405_30380 [Streptomyces macrosporus]|uniref:Uncharacterized protein n=1 Tax=Streptomyces macrosporus TaxID=44032 RepID=A0ABN3K2H5_9ACTN